LVTELILKKYQPVQLNFVAFSISFFSFTFNRFCAEFCSFYPQQSPAASGRVSSVTLCLAWQHQTGGQHKAVLSYCPTITLPVPPGRSACHPPIAECVILMLMTLDSVKVEARWDKVEVERGGKVGTLNQRGIPLSQGNHPKWRIL
jgi:hypothetical protein